MVVKSACEEGHELNCLDWHCSILIVMLTNLATKPLIHSFFRAAALEDCTLLPACFGKFG